MTEIARSISTGLPCLARDVWVDSISEPNNTKYGGSKMFICLDDENCGIQMTLVNWGNPTPKHAAHFKQSSNTRTPHSDTCRMEYGTINDKNELLHLTTGLERQPNLQETIENTISLSQATRNTKNVVDDENNNVPVEKDELWQRTQVKNYDTKRNRIGLAKSKIHRLRAFYLWMNEHPNGIVTTMDWPAYDFQNIERPKYIKSLRTKLPTKVNDILINLDRSINIPLNQVKIYSGHFAISMTNNTYRLTSESNNNLEITIKSTDLKYIMNHSLMEKAANTQQKIKIILCGHFYVNKQKNLQFLRRTKYSGDWISII